MAQQLITDQQVLGANPEASNLERQRKMAELLMSEATDQPKGQMISGHYVAPSWSQMLNPIGKAIAGTELAKGAEEKQTGLINALRGKKATETKEISDAIQAKDWNKASSLIAASETEAGQEYKPLLAKFLVPEQLSEKDKEDIRLRELEIKARNAQHAQQLAQSRVPMGYRMKPDGALEPIPGGPADIKAQTVNAGRETVDTLITGLKDQYDILKKGGGITTKDNTIMNVPAYLSSTGAGQQAGKLFGTENQSARNTIVQSRPLLLAAIKNATGMSAKQMDSNVELKMYLAAATDPSLDYEANMKALNQLEDLYGINGGASGAKNNANLPSANDIDAELARRKKK